MNEEGVGLDRLNEIDEWLDSLDDEEFENGLDSLNEDEFEAYQARELFGELRRRYLWDIFKLVILIAYPAIVVTLFLLRPSLPATLPDWIPSSLSSFWVASLQDAPAIGSISVTVVMAILQLRNVKHFRDSVMPIAEEIKERKIAALE